MVRGTGVILLVPNEVFQTTVDTAVVTCLVPAQAAEIKRARIAFRRNIAVYILDRVRIARIVGERSWMLGCI